MGWLQHVCELALEYAYVPEAVGMVSRPPVCAGLALPEGQCDSVGLPANLFWPIYFEVF